MKKTIWIQIEAHFIMLPGNKSPQRNLENIGMNQSSTLIGWRSGPHWGCYRVSVLDAVKHQSNLDGFFFLLHNIKSLSRCCNSDENWCLNTVVREVSDAQAEIQSRQTKCQYELPVQLNNYGYTFILVFSFSSACVFFCPKNHFKTLEQPVFVL